MAKKAATRSSKAKKKTAKRKPRASRAKPAREISAAFAELYPLDKLKPYDANPRDNAEAVEAVAKSLLAFGWQQPLVVDKQLVLIVGHTRWLAAKLLASYADDSDDAYRPDWCSDVEKLRARDWTWGPVRVASDLSDDEVRAYRIADNKTGEAADWDVKLLPLELDSVLDSSIDVQLTGFSVAELDDLQKGRGIAKPLFVELSKLQPHPNNYREHPADQLQHIVASIEENGIYRNVVVARDNTILAGHGVCEAATAMGLERIPVIRLQIDRDDPRALRILAGDNEIGLLAEVDDRRLTEMLKEINTEDIEGLLGTGYDATSLAALAMVTRSKDEVESKNEAAEWVGMPEYDVDPSPLKVHVAFRNEDDRNAFATLLDVKLTESKSQSIWYPEREKDDVQNVIVEG